MSVWVGFAFSLVVFVICVAALFGAFGDLPDRITGIAVVGSVIFGLGAVATFLVAREDDAIRKDKDQAREWFLASKSE